MRTKIIWKTGLICILLGMMLWVLGQSAAICYAEEGSTGTVYLTISEDGSPLVAKDGTLLAHVPVEFTAFDLAVYGLEEYKYQSGTEPTLLHMLIRATERYYLGRALTLQDIGTDAFNPTCGPGSLYLKQFWGHDQNLMYFVNHEYPLKSAGIGATADTLVLSDGDTVDLAMFTNWSFRYEGQFAYFTEEEITVSAGEEALMTLYTVPTAGVATGEQGTAAPMAGEFIRVSRDGGKTWVWQTAKTNAAGQAVLRFAEPGTYVVVSGPSYTGYKDVAPAVSIITVTGSAVQDAEGCVDFSQERAAESITPEPSDDPDDPTPSGQETVPTGTKYKPGKVTGVKLKAGKKAMRVRWKKVSRATGYQIQYSRDKRFKKNVKTLKLKKCPKNGKKISKLKAKKKYFVRVRAIRKADGRTLYGKWSKIKAVKVKK